MHGMHGILYSSLPPSFLDLYAVPGSVPGPKIYRNENDIVPALKAPTLLKCVRVGGGGVGYLTFKQNVEGINH